MRTMASYTAASPWGWYLPSTSPTIRALFLCGVLWPEAHLVHGVEDAALHRLEAVADVGQRASDDDAHGVVEVGLAHLVLDAAR